MKPNDEEFREIYERSELRKHQREERERMDRMIRGLFPVEVLPKNNGEQTSPAGTTVNLLVDCSMESAGVEVKGDIYADTL